MTGKRILFAAALLGAVMYYIYHSGYSSWFFLVVALCFLPLELLLSLPSWRGTAIRLSASSDELTQGQPFRIILSLESKRPSCAAKLWLEVENCFSGEVALHKLLLRPGEKMALVCTPALCGVVRCRVTKARLLDVAGLFAWPLKNKPAVSVLARPDSSFEMNLPSQPPQTAATKPPKDGRRIEGPPEFTDLREFREGDLTRDIHWKVSAKLNRLMVREKAPQYGAVFHLGFDAWGEAAPVSAALGRVAALSTAILAQEQPYELFWTEGDGMLHSKLIAHSTEFNRYLWSLLAKRLSETGVSLTAGMPDTGGLLLLAEPACVTIYEDGLPVEVLE